MSDTEVAVYPPGDRDFELAMIDSETDSDMPPLVDSEELTEMIQDHHSLAYGEHLQGYLVPFFRIIN